MFKIWLFNHKVLEKERENKKCERERLKLHSARISD
jgi:hypothetical protein